MTPSDSGAIDRLHENAGLSFAQQRLLHSLSGMPLADASSEAKLLDVAIRNMYPILRGLSEEVDGMGLLTAIPLGATVDSQARLWLTGRGRIFSAGHHPLWHVEWAGRRPLDRLPATEWFCHVVGQLVPTMGQLLRFRWAQGQAHDTSADF